MQKKAKKIEKNWKKNWMQTRKMQTQKMQTKKSPLKRQEKKNLDLVLIPVFSEKFSLLGPPPPPPTFLFIFTSLELSKHWRGCLTPPPKTQFVLFQLFRSLNFFREKNHFVSVGIRTLDGISVETDFFQKEQPCVSDLRSVDWGHDKSSLGVLTLTQIWEGVAVSRTELL